MNSVSYDSFQTTYIIWSSCEKLPITTYIIGGPVAASAPRFHVKYKQISASFGAYVSRLPITTYIIGGPRGGLAALDLMWKNKQISI